MPCTNDFGPLIIAAAASLPALVAILGAYLGIQVKRSRSSSSASSPAGGSTSSSSSSREPPGGPAAGV